MLLVDLSVFLFGDEGVPAILTAKIKDLFILFKNKGLLLRNIGVTDRVFDQDVLRWEIGLTSEIKSTILTFSFTRTGDQTVDNIEQGNEKKNA